MKYLNRLAVLVLILLAVIIPIAFTAINKSTNRTIEENAKNAQSYAKESSEKRQQSEAEYTEISKEIPGIVCIGSDLMSSYGTNGTNFASDLQNKLNSEGYKISLINLAVRGENMLTILGRIGVVPFVISQEVTIPETADLIDISLDSSENGYVWPLAVSSDTSNFNPVTVAGYEGMIGGDVRTDPETGENRHYFLRMADGEPFTIPAGSVVNTSSDDEFKDYVHIIWVGENDKWENYEKLTSYIERIVASCGANKNRYLVLGLISGDNESSKEYDRLMEASFGSHYMNVRKYLAGIKLEDVDVDFTDEDKQAQAKGEVPQCFLQPGGLILNDDGYNVLVDYIYNGLVANDCIRKPKNQ